MITVIDKKSWLKKRKFWVSLPSIKVWLGIIIWITHQPVLLRIRATSLHRVALVKVFSRSTHLQSSTKQAQMLLGFSILVKTIKKCFWIWLRNLKSRNGKSKLIRLKLLLITIRKQLLWITRLQVFTNPLINRIFLIRLGPKLLGALILPRITIIIFRISSRWLARSLWMRRVWIIRRGLIFRLLARKLLQMALWLIEPSLSWLNTLNSIIKPRYQLCSKILIKIVFSNNKGHRVWLNLWVQKPIMLLINLQKLDVSTYWKQIIKTILWLAHKIVL